VNVRRPIVYVLLSLLLVLSQQMGISHALSHLSTSRGGAALSVQQNGGEVRAAKQLALDQSCDQCLAFAQIGTALDTGFYSFPVASNATAAVDATLAQSACRRTVCPFQSRAPPVLS
jgi:hypothetical protein